MIPALVLQLVLWTSSASAFYPYTPDWLKEKEEVALLGEAKRNAASSSVKEDGVAFIIEQRGDFEENAESPAQRAAKQAAWLKSKYSHIRGELPAMRHENLHKRSGNTYPVMKAAEPTKSNAAGINQDGTDYSYFIKARLGSKKKELYLLLDTGAGSTWVMGSSCKEKACTLHNNFGHDDSDTLIDKKKSFSISYGTGTVQGDLASDTVSVGGFSVQYTFGLASKTSDDFTHFAFDGILGMSMNQGASDNFLSTVADGKKLDKNIFGVALSRAADGHNTGEVRFGAINPDKYQGDITYTAVDSKDGDWSIQIEDMAYGGKKAGNGGIPAYIDTGTSFVFGPADKVKKLHAVIAGSSSGDGMTFTVPCDSSDDLTFTFSGVNYKLSPKDWISPKDNNGKCTSNIYGHEVVEGAWLLGDTFLKNVYTVFDRDQGRVGFAAAASPDSSPTVSPTSSEDSGAKATAGPSTGTATTLTTMATPSGSSQTKELPLGLSGHETVAIGATGSGTATATATPTQSSTSAATALARSSQYAQMAAAMLSVTVLALTV
ncbi:hypothetical protein E4U47_003183 [Claviceps purpurea]|nr:hypothetical protein E4U10_003919 [Claviceps purpurea]KAG6279538.1 hypothetical protein E4U47_003155 [Claviceps purpurea]KAG6279566.1 hypothetical protein E4U47_003183 [Claviceps purpurea]